jgi:hypothetical protein
MPKEGSLNAACHCGAVKFSVKLSDGFKSVRRCTCSYCSMRGALAVSAHLDGLSFQQGQCDLTLYQFNTNSAKHYFCSKCGIYTHHQRRSNPNEYGVNAACIENISPFDFAEVTVLDGINHPKDGHGERIAGKLRFTPE